MSQTIIIHDNQDLKKLYSINLNTYSGTDVVDINNATDAIALLNILPSIDLIISKNEIDGDPTAIRIYNYIKDNNLDIPLIVIGHCPEISQETLCLKSPTSWELVIQHSSTLLGIANTSSLEKVTSDHVPIPSSYFYEIDHSPCDVYIRIKKNISEFEYIKRIHAQDRFDREAIDKYENQGLKNFYIPRDYQQYFVNFITSSLTQKLEDQSLQPQDRLNINSVGFQVVKEHIHQLGINESIQELANETIQSMMTSLKENKKLAALLKMLLSSKISYAYQHAHLVCVIGDFILSKQKWYEQKHLSIFASAAFLSDITLTTTSQIRINSSEDLKNSKLNNEETSAVNSHANDAANLITGTPLYSEHLFTVIQQHQGSMTGYGFPEEASEKVHQISKIFIIVDYFVKVMLDPKAPKNKKDILSILYAEFSNESYQKIIKVLELKIN